MLLIVCVTTFVLIGALHLSSRFILLSSFAKIEERHTRKDLERVLSAIDSDLSALSALVYDWAAWDDTYEFIVDTNKEYMASNLIDEMFAPIRINVIIFVEASGKIKFGKAYDLVEEKVLGMAEKFSVPKTYGSYHKMLASEDLDAIFCLVEPSNHFHVVMASLTAGLDVFMEKPPGITLFQAESMMRKAEEKGCISAGDVTRGVYSGASADDLDALEDRDLELAAKLARFGQVIEGAGLELEPHRLANYLQELAAEFHNYYAQCSVVGDDQRLTRARLTLISAVRVVLGNALHLLGVHIPETM